eukprot:scpid72999/ scgid25726/ 
MAFSYVSLLLILVTISTVRATSGAVECCKVFQSATDSRVTSALLTSCNLAATLQEHSKVVEFFDSYRSEQGMDKVISVAQCFAPHLNRTGYNALAFVAEGQAMQTNLASIVLGYGCINKTRTRVCDGLKQLLFNDGSYVLGKAPNVDNSVDGLKLNVSVNEVTRQCLVPALGTFESSEYNSGVAQCALGNSIVDFVSDDNVTCQKCESVGSEVPFCAAFFSSSKTAHYGARCERSSVADRMAQSFYSMWMRQGKALFNSVSLNIPAGSSSCNAVMQEIACGASLGACDSNTGIQRPCKATCQEKLTKFCSASSEDAASICTSLKTSSTSPSCPAIGAPVAARVPLPGNFVTVQSTSTQDLYRVTMCLRAQPHNDTLLQTLAMTTVETQCKAMNSDRDCQISSFNSSHTDEDGCPFQIRLTVRVLPDLDEETSAVASSQVLATAMSRQTGLSGSDITVVKDTYSTSIVEAATGNGSGQSSLYASVSILATGLALAFYMF